MELLTASKLLCQGALSDKTGNVIRFEIRKVKIHTVVMCLDVVQTST
jgi:hypothetical protein